MHNLLGLEDVCPAELLRRGRAEVASYGGTVRQARAVTARREAGHFVVGLDDGAVVRARRLLVTSGAVDELPDLPGLRVPTLVLQCTEDSIAPEAVGRYVHERVPGSVFTKLAATGHCPHLSAPEETVAAIRAFLRA